MQFSTLALAALAGLASAQKVTVVTVGMNGSTTFSPSNIRAQAGEMIQFQFVAGNHTVTQSNFDNPCDPISLHNASIAGFHSGFQPAAASAAMGMIPTYTIMINNTAPLWIYCAQGQHCKNGMSMVINENSTSVKTLDAYKKASLTHGAGLVPGQSGTTGGTTGTTTSPPGTASTTAPPGSAAGALSAPSTLGLLGVVAAVFLF